MKSLCEGAQKKLILVYIVSKLKGRARAQIGQKRFNSWQALKEVLTQAFSDNRGISQLMEELNNLRQNKFKSINSYYTRLEQIKTN